MGQIITVEINPNDEEFRHLTILAAYGTGAEALGIIGGAYGEKIVSAFKAAQYGTTGVFNGLPFAFSYKNDAAKTPKEAPLIVKFYLDEPPHSIEATQRFASGVIREQLKQRCYLDAYLDLSH